MKTLLAIIAVFAFVVGCSPTPAPVTSTPQAPPPPSANEHAGHTPPAPPPPAPTPLASLPVDKAAYAKVVGVVDPTNFSWPRTVKTSSGDVTIRQQPQRIHALSVGYDEITLALVPPERVAAVSTFTGDPNFSNVADLVKDVPKVGRNAEQVLAAKPDIIVASPFANTALVKQLRNAGIPIVQVDLSSNPSDFEQDIRFLAYIYGEEGHAEALIALVRDRLARIKKVVDAKPAEARPRVLFYLDKKNAHGKGSTADSIILAAGGVNAAAEAGIQRVQEVGQEAIIEMKPSYIIVCAQDVEQQREAFSDNPSMHLVPAVHEGHVLGIAPQYIGTLSHWNVRGIEELAKLLWSKDFKGVQFGPLR